MLWKSLFLMGVMLCGAAIAMTKVDPESGKCGCCPKCCSCVCDTTTEPPVCEKQLELCIIQDSSGSIGPLDWTVGKNFLIDLLDQFSNMMNRVAHISYSNNATLNWGLDSEIGSDHKKTMEALVELDQFQAAFTNPVEALQLMMSDVFNGNDNPDIPNVCLFLTDGRANYLIDQLEPLANTIHETVTVVVIGVTTKVNMTELAILASGEGDSNIFSADDFNSLVAILNSIVTPLCLEEEPVTSVGDNCFCCCPPPEPFQYPYGGYPPYMMGGGCCPGKH